MAAGPAPKPKSDVKVVTKAPDAGSLDAESPADAGSSPPTDAGTSAPTTREDDAGPEEEVVVGNVFAAWPMPDAFPGSQTAPSYGTRANTVIDTVTRLEWQAQLPEVYSGCTGMRQTLGDCCTWEEAAAYCRSYGEPFGQTGWRLPTKIELESIVDETKYSPAIDTFFFPNTPNHAFWTSTRFTGIAGSAYYVGFATGLTAFGETRFKADVRCVR